MYLLSYTLLTGIRTSGHTGQGHPPIAGQAGWARLAGRGGLTRLGLGQFNPPRLVNLTRLGLGHFNPPRPWPF